MHDKKDPVAQLSRSQFNVYLRFEVHSERQTLTHSIVKILRDDQVEREFRLAAHRIRVCISLKLEAKLSTLIYPSDSHHSGCRLGASNP